MQVYYTSGSNQYTLRVEPITSTGSLTLHLTDMYLLTSSSQSILPTSWNEYESMLIFTASIASASVGSEYRATLKSGSCSIWNGSIQVYNSQSLFSKSSYENQNTQYISNVTDNSYIIMD